jgi:hypothetical protein
VTGASIEGKGGRQFVGAKVLIDCSADADMAAKAHAPVRHGFGETEARMQPVSMYFIMKNVDLVRPAEWARTCDDVPARAIPRTRRASRTACGSPASTACCVASSRRPASSSSATTSR